MEPVPIADDRRDEVVEGLPLDGDPLLEAFERVVAGPERAADRNHALRVEDVGLLLAGVDDDRDARVLRTG